MQKFFPENDLSFLGRMDTTGLTRSQKQKRYKLMRMAVGIFDVRLAYGYHKDWTINVAEAKWVRRVFDLMRSGCTAQKVAEIVSQESGEKWSSSRVRNMIRNEIYAGDIHANRMITTESGRRVKNMGAEPQYYQKDHHVPIITRKDFEKLQRKGAVK